MPSISDTDDDGWQLWVCRQKEGTLVRTAAVSKMTSRSVTVDDLRFLVENVPETTHLTVDAEIGNAGLTVLAKLKNSSRSLRTDWN